MGIPPLGLAPLLIGVLLVGFSWNAVVSITAAYASDRFGISKLGVIYGTMFAVMPWAPAWGLPGGMLYDFRGTYDWAIWSNILLLLVSALLVFSSENRGGLRDWPFQLPIDRGAAVAAASPEYSVAITLELRFLPLRVPAGFCDAQAAWGLTPMGRTPRLPLVGDFPQAPAGA